MKSVKIIRFIFGISEFGGVFMFFQVAAVIFTELLIAPLISYHSSTQSIGFGLGCVLTIIYYRVKKNIWEFITQKEPH
ncbi:hypothetical protein [Kiloniella sp.]|uniref:hypothetical protein n=1 Tax=Kiloniella sp. TaxID=1938587 RepID=UPI003B01EDFB